jgi:hypothetical protein
MISTYRTDIALSHQKFLRTQFRDVPSAKKWLRKWANKDNQVIQDGPLKGLRLSIRTMSGHISLSLNNQGGEHVISSFSTKYGQVLYEDWQCSSAHL